MRVLKRPNFAINKNLQFKKNVKNKIVFIPYSSPEHRFFILQQRSATEKNSQKKLNLKKIDLPGFFYNVCYFSLPCQFSFVNLTKPV